MRTDFIATYSKNNRRGYTLVEILVVVIIIALIAAMAFPAILMSRENARVNLTMSAMFIAILMESIWAGSLAAQQIGCILAHR